MLMMLIGFSISSLSLTVIEFTLVVLLFFLLLVVECALECFFLKLFLSVNLIVSLCTSFLRTSLVDIVLDVHSKGLLEFDHPWVVEDFVHCQAILGVRLEDLFW